MLEYKCDICGKHFVSAINYFSERVVNRVILTDSLSSYGVVRQYDVCPDCAGRIMSAIEQVRMPKPPVNIVRIPLEEVVEPWWKKLVRRIFRLPNPTEVVMEDLKGKGYIFCDEKDRGNLQ